MENKHVMAVAVLYYLLLDYYTVDRYRLENTINPSVRTSIAFYPLLISIAYLFSDFFDLISGEYTKGRIALSILNIIFLIVFVPSINNYIEMGLL